MKKTTLTIALAIAAAFSTTGCATRLTQDSTTAAQQKDTFKYNYTVENRAGAGVLRAFDDGESTIVQFVDLDRQAPTMTDNAGKPLAYSHMGEYAVVHGIYPWISVKVRGEQALITNNDYKSDAVIARTATTDRAELDATRAELDQTKIQLGQARTQLTAWISEKVRNEMSKPDAGAVGRQIEIAETRANGIQVTIYRVPFELASTSMIIPSNMTEKLIATAKAAKSINLRGRTDSAVADAPNRRVAAGRATAARAFLVQNGVDPAKIHVSSLAAGDFVANNKSDVGRAKNRRVEIELIGG